MTIESGGVRANDGERRKFTHHLNSEDRLEIELVGYHDGGLAHWEKYFKRWPMDSYIGGGTVNVNTGEEDELWGLVIKGTEDNTAQNREKEHRAIMEKNKKWKP
ncbi:hypothetical protein KBD45_07870 [Candidatus Dojkabacteria bacterium]|nr:hypothetical protein [Candidatus Dojkabacteria bacterium]